MIDINSSDCYKEFQNHVFGDYQYYYYNGLFEKTCTCLTGLEREQAKAQVLRALKKIFLDERAIRAAGFLGLKEAVSVLERRISFFAPFLKPKVLSAAIWTLLKIKRDKELIPDIIKTLQYKKGIKLLQRADAAELLSDFGEQPSVIDALLEAFLDEDLWLSSNALYSLRKIYRDHIAINELLSQHLIPPSDYRERRELIVQIKSHTGD